ncbi:MAG: hypothetical protein H6705_18160 [Myxococcales bacterium]|nr:hypothetical protein [Myxococcales bacterium]
MAGGDDAAEAGGEREREQGLAERGEAAVVERAEAAEERFGLLDGGAGWGFEPAEAAGIDAPGADFEHGAGEVDAGDLGGVVSGHAEVFTLGP